MKAKKKPKKPKTAPLDLSLLRETPRRKLEMLAAQGMPFDTLEGVR